ncbi:MAG: acyl-CoA thioesterase [Pyrinomonadaceae bacterium]|nr:acyl-CoA thioesterase [Pyrinomonadaceae bacterium]
MNSYEYKHIVGFEETNLVGNVYYANFVRWQGRCREMFLREKAADVVDLFKDGFAMVTTRVSCEYFNELNAFDEVTIRMKLGEIRQNRVAMIFEYWRDDEMVARGEQEIACMQREGDSIVSTNIPQSLRAALQNY